MMKKMMMVAVLMSSFASFSQINFGNDKIEAQRKEKRSNKVSFEVSYLENKLLAVSVSGVAKGFSSIALIDQRGKSHFYNFIESEDEQFEFALSNLKPGKYYVKLHLDNEIRMKSIFIR